MLKRILILFIFSLCILFTSYAAETYVDGQPIIPVITTNITLNGGTKNVGTAGTAVVLASSTACDRVLLKASLDNTGNIFVGGSDVDKDTENGFPLDAGEVWIGTVDNLADIWIDATVSGEGVSFTFEK